MITEYRRLVFYSSELALAIKAFSREKNPKLPEGDITGIVIIGDPQICARIRVRTMGDSSEEKEVGVDASYLAAAMLFHCIKCGVPIPKTAIKTLERAGDGLALSMSINADPLQVDLSDDC